VHAALHDDSPAAAYVARIDERAERDLAMLAQAKASRAPRVADYESAADADARVELIDATGIRPEPIRWLWFGWLARGKLHVLAGAAGTGKTTIAMHFAACVSAGRPWPDGEIPKHGRVVIWTGEDDPADTLVPRLLAAGADLSRVSFVGEVHGGGERRLFDPAIDVPKLATAVAGLDDVALIIVDPLVSAASGDSHKNAETRRSLGPLVELAAKLDAALVGITHFSKGTQGRDPLERVTGSLAFGALARIVFGVVRMVEDGKPTRLIMMRVKSNIGPDDGGFEYRFSQVDVPEHPGVAASRVEWGRAVQGNARVIFAQAEPDDEEHVEARNAADWLVDLLIAGPLPVKDVRRHGNDAGFAWRSLQRAAQRIGVKSKRAGFGLPATWEIVRNRATGRSVAPVAPQEKHGANGATAPDLARLDDGDEVSYEG
jgi:hypothetical protein